MKVACHILIFLCFACGSYAQPYYFRGEIKDEHGEAVQNVSILLHSTGYVFNSGISGAFGFTGPHKKDTLTFSKDGFQKVTMVADAVNYLTLRLEKSVSATSSMRRFKLSSFTKDLTRDHQSTWFVGDESYASILENRFIAAKQFPSTGMALTIDRASYSNIRRFLTMKNKVPPDAVRMEEVLNYFNPSYTEPEANELFHVNSTLTNSPWSKETQMFFINVSAQKLNVDTLPASNLVFLIDISGSMDMPNRLPLLQSAFRMLVNNLRSQDTVSIIVYGGSVGVHLPATGGNEKDKIIDAIDELTPGGSTPGESGIRVAYNMAKRHFIEGGNNRVVLATDGDFNVGLNAESDLEDLILQHSRDGIYLTCLGVGMGNYKDSKIQTLSKKGNGNFAYLDNFQEAEKVLLQEFTQTMYAVADDVSMNVFFNPVYVKEYRLVGFDNKVGALADSLSSVEGGDIGSGHNTMVAFEIIPTPFYEFEKEKSLPGQNFAHVEISYKVPNDTLTGMYKSTTPYHLVPFEETSAGVRFSSALIMFGSLLRESAYLKDVTWNDILAIAQKAHDPDDLTQKEFLTLVQAAKEVYSKKAKKKKRDKRAAN